MNKTNKIILFFLLIISCSSIQAQRNLQVSGKVFSASDTTGLEGVTVTIKGTAIGTTSTAEGYFTINIEKGKDALIFSMVGFNTKEVVRINSANLNVPLDKNISDLENVVVVGYGTVKKSDLTGSVIALRREDFNQGPITSADQLIAGKAAGVQVVQNSAEPGGGISVNIRGAGSINANNSPLYVIDGLALDNSPAVSGSGANFLDSRAPRNPLNSINPSDIQSIEILKDASATAIYGSRGANGVVIITTKTGSKGKLKVNYEAYAGIQNVARNVTLLSPEQYMKTINELIDAGAGSANQKITSIDNGGTDWLQKLYTKNAPIQNHNLSLTGGSENTTFLVSLNYFNQEGILINSSYKRIAGRINLEHNIKDKFKLGVNLSTSYGNDQFVSNGADLNERAGVIYAAFNYDPTLAFRSAATGRYTISNDVNIDNPLAIANGKKSYSNLYRTFGSIYGEYTIIPEIKAKLNLGTDVVNQRRNSYIDRTTIEGLAAGGIASLLQGRNSNYLVEGTVAYLKAFGRHSINAVAGMTGQKFLFDDLTGEARGFPSDATGADNLALGNPLFYRATSDRSENALLSYLGRVNYTFNDKYLLTTSFRADGSSRFGPNNRYGYFPSIALGWKIDQESFLQSSKVISTLKLRVSWGKTGNQDIGNYNSISTFGAGNLAVFNNTQVSTTTPTRIANPDIKWEASEPTDVGLDFGFVNNRISGSVDVYNKNTRDLLLNLPIARETGFTTQLTNVGSVNNKGVDFSLSTKNLIGVFRWNTDITLTTLNNKVIDIGGISNIVSGAGIIQPGFPLYSFYGYKVLGIWQQNDDFATAPSGTKPGDYKFLDVNTDKVVNTSDRTVLGNSFPKLLYSLTNNFAFKQFQLYVFVDGQQGVKMLNSNLVDTYFPANLKRNRLADPLLNRWTTQNPSDKYPSFVNSITQRALSTNSSTVEDASYLRLNTVKLSYSFRSNRGPFTNITVYGSGQNLWTLTKYSGFDPSINPNDGTNLRVDWNAYPTARTFIAGLSINL